MKRNAVLLVAVMLITTSAAHAHGEGAHASSAKPKGGQGATAFGQPGQLSKVTRTIAVSMTDEMRFVPSDITIQKGETVRFVLTNKGNVLHEMVIGTDAELKKHAELMRKFPEMEHDEPYMAHVRPGANGEIVWKFDRKGTFSFACLIPGHYEARMIGTITVR